MIKFEYCVLPLRVGAIVAGLILSGSPFVASAQTPPKIENPAAIPPSVQPGAIEAQYEVDLSPDFSGAPAVLSPFETEQPENADAIRFTLQRVDIDGGGAIPAGQITPLYADKIGSEVPLSDIFEIARSITRAYADAGYPLSLAYVPIQEIENGVVRIRIIEGYIGEIDVIGVSGATKKRLLAFGEKLKSERPLTQSALERYLLLANQLPGVKVTGVLERAEDADGGVKLTLNSEQKKFSIAGGVNNRASEAVGRKQFYGRASLNGLITGADQIGFAAVNSFELDELTYLSANYSTLLTPEGFSLGLKASRSIAAPGIPFLRDLGFETEGWTAGVSVAYPVIVRRGESLSLSSSAEWKEFRSRFDVAPNTLDQLWTTTFGLAYQNERYLNGTTSVKLELTKGWDILGATVAGDPLASRNGAGGEFVAFVADLSRKQNLTDWLDAVAALKLQAANNPLLSSEQCGFGGAGIGRGYNPYQISGDRCAVGIFELQASPQFLDFGEVKVRPYVSVDAGAVRQNGPLAAGEPRTASLYSFAAGARISLSRHLFVGLEGGLPLKDVMVGDDRDMKFFFSLEARY